MTTVKGLLYTETLEAVMLEVLESFKSVGILETLERLPELDGYGLSAVCVTVSDSHSRIASRILQAADIRHGLLEADKAGVR